MVCWEGELEYCWVQVVDDGRERVSVMGAGMEAKVLGASGGGFEP